jgi:hypothetical protein
MNTTASLERGYRRLLAVYPRAFRRENEEEILAVLLATADQDQRRPGLAVSADLVRSGLMMRLRPTVPHSARTVRAAVTLIYLAALAELAAVITIISTSALVLGYVHRTDPAASHAAALSLTKDEIAGPIGIVVLLWLAWAIGRRHDWGRVVFIIFWGITTLGIIAALAEGAAVAAPADFAAGVLVWILQLTAVLLVFAKQSAPYYRAEPAKPAGRLPA